MTTAAELFFKCSISLVPQALAVNSCCIKKLKFLHFAARRVLFHSMNTDYTVTTKSTNIAFKWSTTRLCLSYMCVTKYGLIWCYKNSSFPKASSLLNIITGKVAFYLFFCDAVYANMPINVCAGVMFSYPLYCLKMQWKMQHHYVVTTVVRLEAWYC